IDGVFVNYIEPRSRNIAMAFETYALYPHLTVFENIAFPLRVRKVPESEIKKRVMEIAEALGIEGYLDELPRNLSGGVQQRVGLARALIRPAAVYLLDEVLSHLDAVQRTMLRGELRRLQKLRNLTIIFVTHDQLEALAMSDRVIVMNDGVIQQIGTPSEIYDRPANLFVAGFVGEPPVNTMNVRRMKEKNVDYLVFGEQRISTEDLNIKRLPDKEAFILGIRPFYVKVSASKGNGSIQGRIHTYENLGDFAIITVDISKEDRIFAIVPSSERYELDQVVYISFDPERILFYDKESGRLLNV
ncbi:MAG: glycerol-3-phosphate ABC transporter ATP-binding protein, partial [Thermotoga sp.]